METTFHDASHWYKGVIHFHSTLSDGAMTPEKIIGWYRGHGYDFCALADHLICTDTFQLSAPEFLTIPAIEIHGRDDALDRVPHVVGVGHSIQGKVAEGTSLQGMIDLINEHDMLAIVAHPHWSSLRDEHLSAAHGYIGIEIFNATCWAHIGKGYSLTYWDNLLYDGRAVWGLAVDDAHCHPGIDDLGKGWIVVGAAELTTQAVLAAISDGHFYASQGPSIAEWQVESNEVYVRCSPVERIYIQAPNGGGWVRVAPEGMTITEASFKFTEMPTYLRATCIDERGRRAWTNPVLRGRGP